mmetsp:Transcript_18551/g.58118  ORF Transcript_18551/g.58118 Transcript_18551/m.58118 type:complete len:521 (-) Transcript_18551:9-1571(-)
MGACSVTAPGTPSVPLGRCALSQLRERRELVDGAQGRESNVGIEEALAGDALHLGRVDGVQPQQQLRDGYPAAVDQELTADVLGNGRGGVQAAEERRLQLPLAPLHIFLRDAMSKPTDAKEQLLRTAFHCCLFALSIEAKKPGVLVAGVERRERLRHAALKVVCDGGREPVPGELGRDQALPPLVAANDGLDHHERDRVRVGPRDALVGDCEVREAVGVLAAVEQLGSAELRPVLRALIPRLARREASEELVADLRQLGVLDGAGGRHDHAVRLVVPRDVLAELRLGDGLDVLHGTKDGVSQRTVVEGRQVQAVKDHLLRGLLHFLHLAQDDAALKVEVRLVQRGVLQDVREDVHALPQVLLEALGIVDSLLPGGVGVQVSPHVLDLLLQGDTVPPLRALEGHVLQEVGGAVVLLRLEAAPRIDPHAHSQGLVGGLLGGHAQAVGEGRNLRGWLLPGSRLRGRQHRERPPGWGRQTQRRAAGRGALQEPPGQHCRPARSTPRADEGFGAYAEGCSPPPSA